MTILELYNIIFLGKEIRIPAELFNELVSQLYTKDDADGTLIVIRIEEAE